MWSRALHCLSSSLPMGLARIFVFSPHFYPHERSHMFCGFCSSRLGLSVCGPGPFTACLVLFLWALHGYSYFLRIFTPMSVRACFAVFVALDWGFLYVVP